MSRTLPWYSWYPNDFLGAVRGWSTLQRGGYRDALDAQWTLDGLPADPEELRKATNATPAEFRQIWPKIEPKFPIAEDGRRRNPRLERERQHGKKVSTLRSELGRLGAANRWGGDGSSHANNHRNAAQPDGNSHPLAIGKPMASTVTSTSTITPTPPNSEGAVSRERARPAVREGQRARPNGEVDENNPEVRRRREAAAALAETAAPKKPS